MIPHATKSNVTLIIAAAHPPVPGLEAVSHNRAHFEATPHGCMVYALIISSVSARKIRDSRKRQPSPLAVLSEESLS